MNNLIKGMILFILINPLSAGAQSVSQLEGFILSKRSIDYIFGQIKGEYSAPLPGDESDSGEIGYEFNGSNSNGKDLYCLYSTIFKQVNFFELICESSKLPQYMSELKSNGYSSYKNDILAGGLVKKYGYIKGNFKVVLEIGTEVGKGKMRLSMLYENK